MSSDLFLLDIPEFSPKYDSAKVYSYNRKGKENLKEVLTNASGGYCMYCYTKFLIDRKNFGQLEHSIEKFNSKSLINCISNISITCAKCNTSFKKKGEKERQVNKTKVVEFEKNIKCTVKCLKPCKAYLQIRESYYSHDEAKIILQPVGITNKITGNKYLLQYDLLNQKFIVNRRFDYSDEEELFINKHIDRFNLNDSEYRTREIIYLLEDILEYRKLPKKGRYSNLIVDLFIDKFSEFPIEKVLKICEVIYLQCDMKLK